MIQQTLPESIPVQAVILSMGLTRGEPFMLLDICQRSGKIVDEIKAVACNVLYVTTLEVGMPIKAMLSPAQGDETMPWVEFGSVQAL